MVIIPAVLVAGLSPEKVAGALTRMTGVSGSSRLLWEQDMALSPVLTAVLIVGLVRLVSSIRKHGVPPLSFATKAALICLGLTCWVAVEATLAKGFVYPVLRTLPVVRSLHVNTRNAAVFLLPLAIAGAILLNRWYVKRPPRWQPATVLCLTLVWPVIYLVLPAESQWRAFDVTPSARDYEQIGNGERFPVTRIENVDDAHTFSRRSSSLRPYEPIFGYVGEDFAAQIHVGDIHDERDGRLNMTNPSSLVFPEANGARPFDRIRAADRINLERLAERRQPDWNIPAIVHWLNVLAVVALAACAAIPLVEAIRGAV
jgi:hypothetical protein